MDIFTLTHPNTEFLWGGVIFVRGGIQGPAMMLYIVVCNQAQLIYTCIKMYHAYGTSWPDNVDAVAVQLDKMIINA